MWAPQAIARGPTPLTLPLPRLRACPRRNQLRPAGHFLNLRHQNSEFLPAIGCGFQYYENLRYLNWLCEVIVPRTNGPTRRIRFSPKLRSRWTEISGRQSSGGKSNEIAAISGIARLWRGRHRDHRRDPSAALRAVKARCARTLSRPPPSKTPTGPRTPSVSHDGVRSEPVRFSMMWPGHGTASPAREIKSTEPTKSSARPARNAGPCTGRGDVATTTAS
jgi:hypothetical protein